MKKQWHLPDGVVPPELAEWAEKLDVSPFLVALLWRRGLRTCPEMDAFLAPHLRGLAPLHLWPGLEQAAAQLLAALEADQPLLVWGDYDVDGITGTTLIMQVLEFHGIHAQCHLPDRQTEGYGLNIPQLEAFAAQGVRALLTVDCGISDVAAIAAARALGMRTIISDHHMPPEQLPDADAICNPRLGDSPAPHLAGVGVAFFLMAAVNNGLAERTGRRMDMRDVLDMVTLGTLADVVPITGQNRILVKNGLLTVAQAARPGLAELKAVSGYSPAASLGAGQVVFNLAPRINAAGRMGSAGRALQMLRTPSHEEAAQLARELDAINTVRRAEEDRILAEALEQAQQQTQRAGMVVHGSNWHQGVIGIVASRLVETFYRPVLVLCTDQAHLKGSGRSIHEFDLYAGLAQCADLLTGFGGHKQAAGLRLLPEQLKALRERFDAVARAQLGPAPLTPSLRLDGELDFSQAADFSFLKGLEALQPFGVGNPEPVFASPLLLLRKRRVFGADRSHIGLEVTDTTTDVTLQAKAWRMAEHFPTLMPGARLHLAYTPGINTYNGIASVELRIKDWRVLD